MVVRRRQHRGPDRQFVVEVEGVLALVVQLRLQPRLVAAAGTPHGHTYRWVDDLVWHTVDFAVGGAEGLVSVDDVRYRRHQRVDVTWPGQPGGERNVVDRARSIDAV